MIITRYLSREILNTLIAITFILLLAFLSQQVVRYLNYVAIGKIPANVMLKLISFEVPYLLALLLPLGLYLSILLVYGRLYAENEMAILQMNGFNMPRLTRFTLTFAGFVSGVVLLLMLWANPWISGKRQYLMASGEATLHLLKTLMPGRFQASPDGSIVIYVEKLSRNHEKAKNIFLAQKKITTDSEQPAWSLVVAKDGYQAKNESSDQFFNTLNGYRYEGQAGQNDFTITQFSRYSVRIPESEIVISHNASESLSTWELLESYGNPKHAAELQWRFAVAISTFMLALLAIPMSAVKPRQGRYFMLIPAIIVYIIYINLLFIARRWVENGTVTPMIGMWWLHGLMLLVVWVLYRLTLRSR